MNEFTIIGGGHPDCCYIPEDHKWLIQPLDEVSAWRFKKILEKQFEHLGLELKVVRENK